MRKAETGNEGTEQRKETKANRKRRRRKKKKNRPFFFVISLIGWVIGGMGAGEGTDHRKHGNSEGKKELREIETKRQDTEKEMNCRRKQKTNLQLKSEEMHNLSLSLKSFFEWSQCLEMQF